MRCPLLGAGWFANPNEDQCVDVDCKKEMCAWWNNTECCIKTISIELIRIGEILQDTALPKATQINVRKK